MPQWIKHLYQKAWRWGWDFGTPEYMYDCAEVEADFDPKTREADTGMPQLKLATEISQNL